MSKIVFAIAALSFLAVTAAMACPSGTREVCNIVNGHRQCACY
jgi:hypothetical protein